MNTWTDITIAIYSYFVICLLIFSDELILNLMKFNIPFSYFIVSLFDEIFDYSKMWIYYLVFSSRIMVSPYMFKFMIYSKFMFMLYQLVFEAFFWFWFGFVFVLVRIPSSSIIICLQEFPSFIKFTWHLCCNSLLYMHTSLFRLFRSIALVVFSYVSITKLYYCSFLRVFIWDSFFLHICSC